MTARDGLPHCRGLPGRGGELPRRVWNRAEGGPADDRGEGGNQEGMLILSHGQGGELRFMSARFKKMPI